MQSVAVSDHIELTTKLGRFQVRHIALYDGSIMLKEGVAITSNKPVTEPITVRVQSSCLFSESFWSTDCDCAKQLQESLRRVHERGGMLVYVYEEGRGAGLLRKIEGIRLQQIEGKNLEEAYECLNIRTDSRSYDLAAGVIRRVLGEDKAIKLLTNSPDKKEKIEEKGVNIVEVEPIQIEPENEAMKEYYRQKQKLWGHNLVFKSNSSYS
jgi:GTP cyclohydrolase II